MSHIKSNAKFISLNLFYALEQCAPMCRTISSIRFWIQTVSWSWSVWNIWAIWLQIWKDRDLVLTLYWKQSLTIPDPESFTLGQGIGIVLSFTPQMKLTWPSVSCLQLSESSFCSVKIQSQFIVLWVYLSPDHESFWCNWWKGQTCGCERTRTGRFAHWKCSKTHPYHCTLANSFW